MANEETKIETPTPEELNAEAEAQKEAKEDEVRAAIITEFGFDEVDDAEKIDKLVKKEIEHKGKLSSAIGQKIKYRTLAQGTKPPVKTEEKPPVVAAPIATEEIDKRVGAGVASALEQRDLDEMDLPDEIKTEIKRVAEIQKISVKKAARDPYIVSRIETHEKATATDEAAISRKNKTGGKKNWSIDNPPDVDMSTPEGRKEWEDYKVEMAKQGH